MAFEQEVSRVPSQLSKIEVYLRDEPTAEDVDGNPTPYTARYTITIADQNGVAIRQRGGQLTSHYTIQELQVLRDFMDQLRADAEAQLLP